MSVFPHDVLKPAASGITKRDTEMFHENESREPIHFGVKRSEVKVTRHKIHCQHVFLCACE